MVRQWVSGSDTEILSEGSHRPGPRGRARLYALYLLGSVRVGGTGVSPVRSMIREMQAAGQMASAVGMPARECKESDAWQTVKTVEQ